MPDTTQELPWACFLDVTKKKQTRKCANQKNQKNKTPQRQSKPFCRQFASRGRWKKRLCNRKPGNGRGGHAETHPDSLSCNGGRLTAIVTKACTKFSRFHDETGSRATPAKLSEWDDLRVPAGQDVALTKNKQTNKKNNPAGFGLFP